MKLPTLYGKSSSGSLLIWEVSTSNKDVIVRHGKLGGKITEKITESKEKFVGQSNYRDASAQANFEAEAKWVKQKKKGYYETKEEALGHIEFTPMKLQAWNDYSAKISYPAYVSCKLNGMRYMVQEDCSGLSKQGEKIFLPDHIQGEILMLENALGKRFKGFDGEVYSGLVSEGGLSLQKIISAFRKPNDDTPLLKYWIYDIPDSTEPYYQRLEMLDEIADMIEELNLSNVVVLNHKIVNSKDDVITIFERYADQGHEGVVVRNARGMYEFGKRSYDAQKVKVRQTTEAEVISVEEDKNNQGVLSCRMQNGVEFKCLMLKNADLNCNLRLYENAVSLIGSWIEVEYEELSDNGVLTKPVGLRVRSVNPNTFEGE